MSVQIFQVLQIAITALLLWLAYRTWRKGKKVIPGLSVGFIIFMFFFNPIKMTQDGMSPVERNIDRFSQLPDKVVDKKVPFQVRQDAELHKLKQQSEDSHE